MELQVQPGRIRLMGPARGRWPSWWKYKGAGIRVRRKKGRPSYLLHFQEPKVGGAKLLSWGESNGLSGASIEKAIVHSYPAMCDFVTGDPLLTPCVRTIYI